MIKFATVLSDNYMPLFEVLIKSLKQYNTWFDNEFVIICDDTLNIYNRDKVKSLYKNISFLDIDYSKYNKKSDIKFKSIECFSIKAEKIIFLDTDLLCLGDIKYLTEIEADISMARELNRPCFNAGVMVINKKYLNEKTYNDLLNYDISNIPGYGTDQKIYNNYFSGEIIAIDSKYNTLVSEVKDLMGVKFLHYIHKPHIKMGQKRLTENLINLWRKYYET